MAKVMKASGKRVRGKWTVRVAGGGKSAKATGGSLAGALKKASAKLSHGKKRTHRKGKPAKRKHHRKHR